jgi:uncharacterized protein (DUF58 family)
MHQATTEDARELLFPGWGADFARALERLAIAARRPAGGQYAGAVRSRTRGRALEFVDARPYAPGDDPKLVDWRAYARLGRLYLRQYAEERARTVTLLVDASGSLDWGEGDSHKGRYVRRLAAALAWIGLSRQDRVRVFLLRDGSAAPLPPAFGLSQAPALFRGLGAVRERGGTDLAASLRAALAESARGPVVLLSDLLDPGWSGALQALAAGGEGIVLQVLAPSEWEPPLGEEVELEDAETGELRATRLGPSELAAYRARLDGLLADIGSRCRRLDLRYLALDSSTPLLETVLRRLPAAGVVEG